VSTEREASGDDRHDRVILGARNMVDADSVPQDDILILNGAVLSGPGDKAGIFFFVLVREISGCINYPYQISSTTDYESLLWAYQGTFPSG
jgi:hypothetical protein